MSPSGVRPAWQPLQRPDELLSLLLELPLGLGAGLATFVAWLLLAPIAALPLSFETLIAAFAGAAFLHEFIRRSALPRLAEGADRRVQCISGRRQHERPQIVSRSHYLAALLLPLLLSALLPLIASTHPTWRATLVVPSVVNALVSAGDLLAAILVLAQVPAGGVMCLCRNDVAWQPKSGVAASTLAER